MKTDLCCVWRASVSERVTQSRSIQKTKGKNRSRPIEKEKVTCGYRHRSEYDMKEMRAWRRQRATKKIHSKRDTNNKFKRSNKKRKEEKKCFEKSRNDTNEWTSTLVRCQTTYIHTYAHIFIQNTRIHLKHYHHHHNYKNNIHIT